MKVSPAPVSATKSPTLKQEGCQNVALCLGNNYKLRYSVECTAVDTLVKLTKGNVDALCSMIFPAQNGIQDSSH